MQVLLLHDLGLRSADFQRLVDSRPEIFQMGIVTMRRKLKFFQDTIGLRCGRPAGRHRAGSTHAGARNSPSCRSPSCRLPAGPSGLSRHARAAPPCSNAELTKVIVKFPRILEYKSERTIRPRLDFLRRCGVAQEDLAKVR